jgi:hypothetical protein
MVKPLGPSAAQEIWPQPKKKCLANKTRTGGKQSAHPPELLRQISIVARSNTAKRKKQCGLNHL